MAAGHGYVLKAVLGLSVILLILSFSAYRVTTFDSVREVVGGLADASTMKASLHSQYQDMKAYFNDGKGDVFIYYFGGMPVAIDKSAVNPNDEAQCTGLVLDIYTSSVYHADRASGIPGAISDIAGANGNGLYLLIALLVFLIFAGTLAATVLGSMPVPVALRSNGVVISVVAISIILISLIGPGLLMSFTWDTMPGVDGGRGVVYAIISGVAGTLLFNCGVLLVLGLIMYGAGYYLNSQGPVISEEKISRPPSGGAPPQKPGRKAL